MFIANYLENKQQQTLSQLFCLKCNVTGTDGEVSKAPPIPVPLLSNEFLECHLYW